jgi:aspartate oxidase
MRPESRGLNFNLDFPAPNPDWAQRDSIIRRGN